MLRCNIETTLLFPYATSVLLEELMLENEVLSDKWKTMLAAIEAERPERPFVLTLDQAKAKNAAKNAAQAYEPQLGPQLGAAAEQLGPQLGAAAEQLGPQLGAAADQLNLDNCLNMDHPDNGTVRQNPGEIVALFKTMNELAGLGYEVDWGKKRRIYQPTCPLSKKDNNTVKSIRFGALMTKHLGNNGRIPRTTQKYIAAKRTAWFTALHDKYRNKNI
jgi:hypothetical protein